VLNRSSILAAELASNENQRATAAAAETAFRAMLTIGDEVSQALANHIQSLNAAIARYDAERERHRATAIEFLQVGLSGVGVAAIYEQVLEHHILRFTYLDLMALSGTGMVWAAVPMVLYAVRRRSLPRWLMWLSGLATVVGIFLSSSYLVQRLS
jgi:hypothetical protein